MLHKAILRPNLGAFYELRCEAVPDGHCHECGKRGKLFRFTTVRGTKEREHDRFHGLKRPDVT